MPYKHLEAVIFDLDGVITKTALVHSSAWKKMFDSYLKQRQEKTGGEFVEFSHENDYLKYVDGKPRYEGVKSFLESRGIHLPFGDPSDPPDKESICGIGNRKNQAFNEILQKEGVEVYDSTVFLIRQLKEEGIHVGVASSSKNCKVVLEAAGLLDLFETRIDGEVSAELGLKGKPAPDIFTTAADRLGVSYDKSVIVEDAVSGVQAGKKGNFGLVLGIAREGNEKELLSNGADIVVSDIGEIGLFEMKEWFKQSLDKDNWKLIYHDYDPEKEGSRESLLSVGNGYFATRGAMEEIVAGPNNYPGTYMAGVYNRLVSEVGGKKVENEDLVNVINWLPLSFRIDEDDWIDINKVEIVEIQRTLNMNSGLLCKKMIIKDRKGRLSRIESRRLASMDDPHLAAMEYCIKPINYSGKISLRSGLYGDHINDGVERYRDLNQHHIAPLSQGTSGNLQYLEVKTTQSEIKIAAAALLYLQVKGKLPDPVFIDSSSNGRSILETSIEAETGKTIIIRKIVSLFRSDEYISEPLEAARSLVEKNHNFQDVLAASEHAWEAIWDRIDIRIEGDRLAQKLLRLHLYHLMVTYSPHNATIDAGIPARGLHGEAYRGHIFWDELFVLPVYFVQYKDTARAALMYRYHRLDEARKYAKEYGFEGAMFPWQSGSSGREETQVVHLNPVSGKWGEDYSSLQRHVSLAIAYNIWQYFHYTGDLDFMSKYGAEMFLEICRFWASKCEFSTETGRYSVDGVMGPDEFHEKYPDANKGGLKDNAYTNLMLAWAFEKAWVILKSLSDNDSRTVLDKINMKQDEPIKWDEIRRKLRLVIAGKDGEAPEGIISQYDGYFSLKELDWDSYRKKYGNVYRMDRILKSEGKSPDEYKVAKQADTLMTFFNLEKYEVDSLLKEMGYQLPDDYLQKNLEYYLARTSHGSSLSRVVHARLAIMIGMKDRAWELYMDALTSDYDDIQGGTTAEGIHAGVMAGTAWIALTAYAGLNLNADMARFKPNLPTLWKKLSFGFDFKGDEYECEISKESLRIRVESKTSERVRIELCGKILNVVSNEWNEFEFC